MSNSEVPELRETPDVLHSSEGKSPSKPLAHSPERRKKISDQRLASEASLGCIFRHETLLTLLHVMDSLQN